MEPRNKIRLASLSEKEQLESLQMRASLRNAGDRERLLSNPGDIGLSLTQIERGQVFVSEATGSINGFAAIASREHGDFELDALFVEPGHWRQGLGRALVNHSVQAARNKGARALHVVGNPHAEGFYIACGFELLGTTATQFGVGLLMRRSL